MDVARPSNRRQKQIRRAAWAGAAIIVIASVSFGLARLKPAAPTVEAATLWPDTVKRGPMVRQVRGIGTLVPEDIRKAGGIPKWVVGPLLGRALARLGRHVAAAYSDSRTRALVQM
jgi:hypothetical protein